MTSFFRGAHSFLATLFLVILALAAVAAAVPRVLWGAPYVVLSPSMEPACPVGSVLYVRKTVPEDIAAGEIITFRAEGMDLPVTHRVTEVDGESRLFRTKGDANEAEDAAPVPFANVIGTPAMIVPKLGYVYAFIVTPPGTYAAVAAVALMALTILTEKREKKKKPRRKNKEQSGAK